jgi:membrane protease YdiL (CAAX protease family)
MDKDDTINLRVFAEHLLITFLIMGVCWGLCIVLSVFDITIRNCFWLYIPWFIGGISPAIASFIVLKKNRIVNGFVDWIKHVFDFKHKIWSYLLAITFPIIQVLMMCLISGFKLGLQLYWLPLMILAMVFAGGLEEAGWRYITYPFLRKKCGFILAALIVTIIWWVWHMPLFFIPETSQYHKDFLVFGIMVLGMSFMLAAIREITGSVWLCILCHAIINSAGNFFHYDMYGSYLASSITTASLMIISIIIVLIYRRFYLIRE